MLVSLIKGADRNTVTNLNIVSNLNIASPRPTKNPTPRRMGVGLSRRQWFGAKIAVDSKKNTRHSRLTDSVASRQATMGEATHAKTYRIKSNLAYK